MKYLLAIITSILFTVFLHGQQDILLTNFSANSLFLNPAYAGSNGYKQGSVFFNYRDQWMGLDGSPKTMMVGGENNLFNDRVGLGGSISRESIGIDTRIDLLTNSAYRLKFENDNEYLSFGLRVGFHLFSSDFGLVNYSGGQDLVYDGQNDQFSVLTVGTGIFYTNKNSYVGFSIPRIMNYEEGTFINAGGLGEFVPNKQRHYFLTAGYVFHVNDWLDLNIDNLLLP